MESVKRPLSPHLQIYKPQLTSLLSIMHRGTGVFLSFGALLLCIWLLCLAAGEQNYNNLMQHISAWYGKLLLLAFIFSIFYHLANGIRHLFWDAGFGLEISTTYRSGYVVVISSLVLTLVTVLAGGML